MQQATAVPSRTKSAKIFIVDDDEGMRKGVRFLLRAAGYEVECFDSAKAFLAGYQPVERGCAMLDIRMPGMSGLELQEELRARNIHVPIVIVTAYGSVPMAVRAMRSGAFDIIEKPFEGDDLIARLERAMDEAANQQLADQSLSEIEGRVNNLTPRERQVMQMVISGMLSKQIAAELNIAQKTVDNHRANLMEKMQADTIADLVRMAMTVGAY